MTARQALHSLKTSGYAFSQRGRGTFVTRPKMEKSIMHLLGFTEDMKQRGMVPSSRVLEQTVIKATEELARNLKVSPGALSSDCDVCVWLTAFRWRSKNRVFLSSSFRAWTE